MDVKISKAMKKLMIEEEKRGRVSEYFCAWTSFTNCIFDCSLMCVVRQQGDDSIACLSMRKLINW